MGDLLICGSNNASVIAAQTKVTPLLRMQERKNDFKCFKLEPQEAKIRTINNKQRFSREEVMAGWPAGC